MNNDNPISPNPDEPYFIRPLTQTEFRLAVRECGREVGEYARHVSLRLGIWNIQPDEHDKRVRADFYRRGLLTFATNHANEGGTNLTREYSYLMMFADMLNTWHSLFEKYAQGCDCDECNNTHTLWVMCDQYIKGLAEVEVTAE